jgi:hypothetical protein
VRGQLYVLATNLAADIVGVPRDATRDRMQVDGVWEPLNAVKARRVLCDRRDRIADMLVEFAELVRSAP